MTVKNAVTVGDYAGGFLPPVLQGMQAKGNKGSRVINAANSDDAAGVTGVIRHSLSLRCNNTSMLPGAMPGKR
jgi:hypothetical protein